MGCGLMMGGRYNDINSSFWEYWGELCDPDLVNLLVQT